ncbi:MAG: hypothetical protein NZN28_01495 [Meiothermus sp.]|uniref:hypothetical protein n=1 Tax=Meiothermus sp. TaxID=1955249 RepID=UPI0025E3B40C|nr:hypothetical protein [Meiothermus sp.]MCS7067295.1 hypothetical protein [Meiothermus sp.]
MNIELAALLISVLALLFSLWSWRKGFDAQNSGNRIQEKLASLQARLVNLEETKYQQQRAEALKARVVVEVVREPPNGYTILLRNTGSSAARNLQVHLDDKPYNQHPHIGNQNLPSLLNANSTASIKYFDAFDFAPPRTIRVTWVNENGEQDVYEAALQIP